MKSTPPPAQRTGPFRPTLALQMPKADVPASPWMWAKAAHKLAAVIRKRGDRAVWKEVGEGGASAYEIHPSSCTENRTVQTHPGTPDAQS
jgi:hypothetical protein